MSRTVTLVLVDGAGVPLGTPPPFETALPWRQELTEVRAVEATVEAAA
ncbi:MAG TPA: hypothetical protein VHN80_22305 [Kineosporiaceae bacterium]|nr:hypothetical protein [Kineosporiaceae bacterium]